METLQTPNPHAERRIAVSERTVTEAEVIAAMNKHSSRHDAFYSSNVFDELFPELPKGGELIWVWNGNGATDEGAWRKFFSLDADGNILTKGEYGDYCEWENFRRQTPAEKGEG
jgi:hypothetical protein